MYVLISHMLPNRNKMQLRTCKLRMPTRTYLTIKQLKLIRYMRTLIPQQTIQLIIHLRSFQYGQNDIIVEKVQYTVL